MAPAHQRDVSNSSTVQTKDCDDCVRIKKRREGHRFDPSQAKYCRNHQCPVERTPGVKCLTRKSKKETQCSEHLVPICSKDHCDATCVDNTYFCPNHSCQKKGCKLERDQPSRYCQTHTCSKNNCNEFCAHDSPFCHLDACLYRGCPNEARPGQGLNFCLDHKCSDETCQSVKRHIEFQGVLHTAPFCSGHECRTDSCGAKKALGKDHCNKHCCTKPGCRSFHQGDLPGTFCLQHYNESIREQSREEFEAQLEAQRRAQAQREAQEAAENRRRAQHEAQQAAEQQRQAQARAAREEERRLQAERELERERGRKEEERRLQVERELERERKRKEEDDAIQKALRESAREQHRKEEEAARVKAERDAAREWRQREYARARAEEEEKNAKHEQAEIDRAVKESLGLKLKRDREAAAIAARLKAERDAEDARRHRQEELEREEEKIRRKREQNARHHAEKDDVRLRPEAAVYSRNVPSYDSGRTYYADPKPRRESAYRDYDEGYGSPSPGPAGSPRGQKREHSPRVSADYVDLYDAEEDDFARPGPSRSRPYAGKPAFAEPQPQPKKKFDWDN